MTFVLFANFMGDFFKNRKGGRGAESMMGISQQPHWRFIPHGVLIEVKTVACLGCRRG